MAKVKTLDNHPAIMIKQGVLARSGVYLYSHDEMIKRGFTPPVKKEFYKEYRPAAVLIRCKDKFAFSAVTVEHTPEETNPDNFRDQASGVVGDTITVDALESGEVALTGNIAIYTQDAADYYNAGHKETSADYRSKVVLSKNPEYDLELVDIISVNGVVLTERGRGGPSVRVMDSMKSQQKIIGGFKMKHGVLGFLGIGRAKDKDEFKLSKIVMDGVKKTHSMGAEGIGKVIDGVMEHITPLNDSETREILIGAVTDSFKHPVEVVAKEKEVSEVIDKLYSQCLDADAEALKKTMDAAFGTKDGEEGDEKKAEDLEKKAKENLTKAEELEGKTKDSANIIEEAVAESLKRVTDSIPGMIDAAVAKALGVEYPRGKKPGKQVDERTLDSETSSAVSEDSSFLLNDVFGSK